MKIGDVLRPSSVVLDLRAPDKRRLIDDLARRVATIADLAPSVIGEALHGREQLGSTGVGEGIAIPHARLPDLLRTVGFFARLRSPLDFDAIDGRKVDLVFLLLIPAKAQAEQLDALASVARCLRREEVRAAIRAATSPDDAYAALVGSQAPAVV